MNAPARIAPHLAKSAPAPAAPARPPRPAARLAAPGGALGSARPGGSPLPGDLRGFLEPRFGADFSGVRLHTDPGANTYSNALGARAVTYGRDIYFGPGQYKPQTTQGVMLIAHELAHTIQQRSSPAAQRAANDGAAAASGSLEAEAQAAAATVIRGARAEVRGRTGGPVAQRAGFFERVGGALRGAVGAVAGAVGDLAGTALGWIRENANLIPGYRLLSLILRRDPLTGSAVDATVANQLRAFLELTPMGVVLRAALDRYGLIDRVGGFIQEQLSGLADIGGSIAAAVRGLLASLSPVDIVRPGAVWERCRNLVQGPINRVTAFAQRLVSNIVAFIRDAVLRPLADLASRTRGWPLLCAVLGRNPITKEAVARTPDTLIGGFLRLIGQEEVWENIRRSGAIPRAWAWFQTALAGLLGFVQELPGRFMESLRALTIPDLVSPLQAFGGVARVFGGFVAQFIDWAGRQVMRLLEIIFEVVAPAVMPYLRRAAGAFGTIVRDPIRFVGNLVSAALLGFRQFAGNFVTHLRAGLIGWLAGAMGGTGVYIPKSFNLSELVQFILSVLSVTWANLRGKLVRVIGEPAASALETGMEFVKTLVTQGPAAAWEQIVAGLTNLRDMVVEQVMGFVNSQIVQIAITRLIASLNPAGAFIQAVLAIYNTIMFLVERLQQIAQVAASFIDSIATIAAGTIAPAATKVVETMARLLPLVISFLARLIGLGNVGQVVTRFLDRVRQPIERGLDRVVAWIVGQARRLGRFVAQAGVPQDPMTRLRLASQASIAIATRLPRTGLTAPVISRAHDAIKLRFGLTELTPYQLGGAWHVRAVVNPPLVWRLPLPGETAGTGGIGSVAVQTGPGGVVRAGARGELRQGIQRQGMENVLPISSNLTNLAFSYLRDYRRAHLYGPGFGDETSVGLMYASAEVNNRLQSSGRFRGIEGYARQIRQLALTLGGRSAVEVVAASFRDPPPGVPQPLGQPVLRRVDYTFLVVNSAGEEVRLPRGRASAFITCAPPRPNGAGGQGDLNFARLDELHDYLSSRSTKTGL